MRSVREREDPREKHHRARLWTRAFLDPHKAWQGTTPIGAVPRALPAGVGLGPMARTSQELREELSKIDGQVWSSAQPFGKAWARLVCAAD